MKRNTGKSPEARNTRRGGRGLSWGAALCVPAAVLVAFGLGACGQKKDGGDKGRDTGPVVERPSPLPPEGSGPGVNSAAQKLDGTWRFAGFECIVGELTPWAKLENELVSPKGWSTGQFQWFEGSTGSSDSGVLKRSHIWTITGDSAVKEDKLEFVSAQNAAAGTRSSAWASTTKSHTLSHSPSGQLILEHGKMEGPNFAGLPLTPLLELIGRAIEQDVARGGVSSALLSPVRSLQNFLARTLSRDWIQGVLNFVGNVTEATETVTYTLSPSDMTFTEASVVIRGFDSEAGLALVDVTVCGMGGKALRRYIR